MQARYIAPWTCCTACACSIAGVCLVVITIIIPWGVFTRYVLNYGSSWPEPLAVLLMIWFSFTSAALCYRERLHISVQILPAALQGRAAPGRLARRAGHGRHEPVHAGLGRASVHTTWFQAISDFPPMSVGISYLPVPIGGAITLLFVIERLWTGGCSRSPSATTWRPWASSRAYLPGRRWTF